MTKSNRWTVVVGAVLIQLSLGAIYAWSVFTPYLKDLGWSRAQTQGVFAAGLATFAVVMVWAGRVLPKFGPRKLTIAGGLLLGVGYILAGLIGRGQFWTVFFTVGILGGAGIGLGYVVPIAVGMRWFPEKKGLITGLAVAGFGFGAMLWIKLAGSWGHLLQDIGLQKTFILYGVCFAAIVLIGSTWMVFPKEVTPQPKMPGTETSSSMQEESLHFTSRQMLRTSEFYMIFLTFVFSAGAGLMCIGLMKLFPMSVLAQNGYGEEAAGAIAGTAMAVFFSLANGIGRIAWGTISDHLGRKRSLVLMAASQGVLVILFQWMAGIPYLLYFAATLIGFNFGGNFSLFPTITADTFGTKNVGANYGWVFLAYGVGGIFGPILGGALGDLENFPLAFSICGGLCLLAAGLISRVGKPVAKLSAQPAA